MKYLPAILCICLIACVQSTDNNSLDVNHIQSRPLAKFEPRGENVLVFVGQELEAIGGLESPYNDGYLDHFDRPAGFTMYTNLSPGGESYGFQLEGLDGIFATAEWGEAPSNMSLQLADPDFENMALAIGLNMVNHDEAVAAGERDDLIQRMGEWLKSLGKRPVFLRIGYEFDGHSWNHYDRVSYIKAFRRVKDKLDALGVNNVAYVWQSVGWVSDPYQLEEWYPGDEYVDWCGFSFFSRWREVEMYDFARKKDKPVFIAEATPTISDHTVKFDGQTKEVVLSNPQQADEAIEKWFDPFFKAVNENADVVKAISYINCHWKSHEMWKDNPGFQYVDARLQTSEKVTDYWNEKMNDPRFIQSSEGLYDMLWDNKHP